MVEALTTRGRVVRASTAASLSTEDKPLRCRYCPAGVEGVGAYFKGKGGPKPVKVGAHFRLSAGQRHQAGCAFNAAEVVQAIARGSQGLAQVDEEGRLRLVLPGEKTPQRAPAARPAGGEATGGRTALRITTRRPPLVPALNSAAKVAHFLQLHDFDPKAVGLFSVLYGDRTRPIPWSRFCYHAGTAADLHQVVVDGPRPCHPVAFHGTVRRTAVTSTYVTLDQQVPHDGGPPFSVRLRTKHPQLLKELRDGHQVLAVGTWSAWPTGNEIRIWLEEHWQLAFWGTDPATGAPGAISFPKPLPPSLPGSASLPVSRRPAAPRRAAGMGGAVSGGWDEQPLAPDKPGENEDHPAPPTTGPAVPGPPVLGPALPPGPTAAPAADPLIPPKPGFPPTAHLTWPADPGPGDAGGQTG